MLRVYIRIKIYFYFHLGILIFSCLINNKIKNVDIQSTEYIFILFSIQMKNNRKISIALLIDKF